LYNWRIKTISMNNTKTYLTLLFSCFYLLLNAQGSSSRDEVKATIIQLFDGMRAGDSSIVAQLLHPDAVLQSVGYNKENKAIFKTESAEGWLTAISSYPAGTLDERLYSMVIEVDEPLATAWTEYSFFADGKLSHCGTNAFQLFKSENGWIVHHITDTRRRKNCTTEQTSLADSAHAFVDTWHQAAAIADEDVFFGSMAKNGIYLGTDATERWERDVFKKWASFAFERESAWDFTARDRNIYFSDNQQYFWWEEMLDTWMGVCRGSGVAKWIDGRWQILHYDLSIMVPNDKVNGFLELMKE